MRALVFVLAATIAACTPGEPLPIDDMACPTAGTPLTYDNFGANFFASYCNSCHSSAKSGAPRDIKFDSLADVQSRKDRIFIRAAGPNVTMPPGPDDPPAADRDKLAEWLACGAN